MLSFEVIGWCGGVCKLCPAGGDGSSYTVGKKSCFQCCFKAVFSFGHVTMSFEGHVLSPNGTSAGVEWH